MSVMHPEPYAPGEYTVTEPGVYDMPNAVYHCDPVPGGSLSSTGARRLIEPSCPAKFAWAREHGEEPKAFFDFGHAAHRSVLSEGEVIEVIDAPDWRTKAAREKAEQARLQGRVPLLGKDAATVEAMAAKIREHPIAGAVFRPGAGTPEQSLFWRDRDTRIWRRARIDWLPHPSDSGRIVIADYKTAAAADLESLPKAVHRHGYHQQAAWYLDAIRALELSPGGEPALVFVFQEKDPPHVVTVVELDMRSLAIGRLLNRRAIDTYVECTRTGRWPGYADEVVLVELPHYVLNEYTEQELASA
jgi:hypothetical protein